MDLPTHSLLTIIFALIIIILALVIIGTCAMVDRHRTGPKSGKLSQEDLDRLKNGEPVMIDNRRYIQIEDRTLTDAEIKRLIEESKKFCKKCGLPLEQCRDD